MKIFITAVMLALALDAKIIEVNQLFNKKIVSVKEQNISIKKTFYANTVMDESKVVDIVTRYDGFIDKLYADKTLMYIDKNSPLFKIYSDDVISAQMELLLAKKIQSRNSSLYKSAYNKLVAFGLSNKTLRSIKNSSKKIKNFDVYSPVSGFIMQKNINEKGFVKKGKLLFQIVDLSELWVIVKVYQKDLNFIQEGMDATIKIDGVDKKIKGKVDFIYPKIDNKTKTIDVRVIIENKEQKLFPNMFAKVDFSKPPKTLLTLPRSAVLTKGDKHFVFKPIDEKEFEPVSVAAKRIDSRKFEIISGLKEGDKVIDKVLFMLDSDAVTNGLYDSDEDEDW